MELTSIEALGAAGDKPADDSGQPSGQRIFFEHFIEVTQNGHGLDFAAAKILIDGTVIMGNPKFGIGFDQRLVQHLLLFVIHIRDQKGEKDHQLLNLLCQHGVDVGIP